MDTGRGILTLISDSKATELISKRVEGVFSTGQEVEVNGSKFVIHAINKNKLILKLLPK